MSRSSAARLGLLGLIWGSSFLLMKFALVDMTPAQLVLGRLAAGAAVLWVVVRVSGGTMPRQPAVWGHLLLMSILGNIVPFFLFAWGEVRVTSGMAGILNGTTPLFTLIVALVALHDERWTAQRIGGLLLGFVGVVVVVGPWNTSGVNAVSGQIACLGAAMCYGVVIVYARRFLAQRHIPPLSLSAAQLSLATVVLAVTAPITMRGTFTIAPLSTGSMLVLGALGTGFAYLLFYRLLGDIGATSTSLVTYIVPVVAVFLGVVVQDDPLTWNIFVGAAIVFASAALAEGRIGAKRITEAPLAPAKEEVAG